MENVFVCMTKRAYEFVFNLYNSPPPLGCWWNEKNRLFYNKENFHAYKKLQIEKSEK